jgi:hypothetical protein
VHVEVGGEGHGKRLPGVAVWVKWRAVVGAYLLMGATYVLGGALLGLGVYLARRDSIPDSWRRWMQWPLVEVTPTVTHLQGYAGIALGLSLIALGLTPVVPELVGGVLVLVAVLAYVATVGLFLYSTWISRRVAR